MNGGGAVGAGDRGHCTADGRQFDALYAPPCIPRFTGDNGGATSIGVSADTIDVVFFYPEQNEQVSAIVGPPPERAAALEAFSKWINRHYELYGRTLRVKQYYSECPNTPKDYDRCYAAAREVVKMKPFAVVWYTSAYPEMYDIWAEAGIISLGGFWFDQSFYTDRRPYRWDLWMDGSQTADLVAAFYCKNMAVKRADHAGVVIHPSIGGRATPRRLAIIGGDDPSAIANGRRVQSRVRRCTRGAETPFAAGISNNIDRAATSLQSLTSKLISEKVTTVICLCESVSTAIVSSYFTANNYFPEHLLNGQGYMDTDETGRLADDAQWAHAFGLSQLGLAAPVANSDSTRAWREQGKDGLPCGESDCNLEFGYLTLIATGAQVAGPQLRAANFEAGLMALSFRSIPETEPRGGFGPSDYTFFDDVKLVYWDERARSTGDRERGAYVPLSGGRRYTLSELPSNVMSLIPVADR